MLHHSAVSSDFVLIGVATFDAESPTQFGVVTASREFTPNALVQPFVAVAHGTTVGPAYSSAGESDNIFIV